MNLAQTDAQWKKFARELALYLAVRIVLMEMFRRFDLPRNREQVVEEGMTGNGMAGGWVVKGARVGVTVGANAGNTDEDGLLYVRRLDETPGAGQSTVNVYSKAGGGSGDKVMTGFGNDNTTFALTAANSSGMTASVPVGVCSADEIDDKRHLRIIQDFPLRARNLFDGSEAEHPALNTGFDAACLRAQDGIQSAMDAFATALLGFWLSRGKRFLKSSQGSPMRSSPADDQGAISVNYRGIAEDMRKDMLDELTGAVQSVLKTVVSVISVVFVASNQGKAAMANPTMEEWASAGPIKLTCDTDDIGGETFRLSQIVDITGETINAERTLTMGRAYSDAKLGIRSMLMTPTPLMTPATAGAADFATSADFSVTGYRSVNTAAGVFSLKVRAGTVDPAKFVIEFYKDATYVASSLVGHSAEGAANAIVGISYDGSSGLGGFCKIGTAPTVGRLGTLDMQCMKAQNSGGVADELTVTIGVTSFGRIQKQIADLYKYRLNSAASNPTLPDSLATASTFPPFSVADV